MARLGRYFVSGQPLHVIQRGNDRKPVFFEAEDHAQYREWLIAAAGDNGLAVHAYVLMTNHVHLLVVPQTAESLPRTMQSLGRRYVRHINARHRRTGTLWERLIGKKLSSVPRHAILPTCASHAHQEQKINSDPDLPDQVKLSRRSPAACREHLPCAPISQAANHATCRSRTMKMRINAPTIE
jgi:REP element-mobilizing transposase RayT